MALTTNRCNRHGHAYVEAQCPVCVAENYLEACKQMETFFDHFGDHELINAPVTIEELFQHFRVRLLEEAKK